MRKKKKKKAKTLKKDGKIECKIDVNITTFPGDVVKRHEIGNLYGHEVEKMRNYVGLRHAIFFFSFVLFFV